MQAAPYGFRRRAGRARVALSSSVSASVPMAKRYAALGRPYRVHNRRSAAYGACRPGRGAQWLGDMCVRISPIQLHNFATDPWWIPAKQAPRRHISNGFRPESQQHWKRGDRIATAPRRGYTRVHWDLYCGSDAQQVFDQHGCLTEPPAAAPMSKAHQSFGPVMNIRSSAAMPSQPLAEEASYRLPKRAPDKRPSSTSNSVGV